MFQLVFLDLYGIDIFLFFFLPIEIILTVASVRTVNDLFKDG